MKSMKEFIFGMVSALIAYGFNRILLRWQKEKSILFMIPFVEEVSKTSVAILSHSSMIGVHVVFGVIEAFYDVIHTKEQRVALIAAVLSLISHSIFGIISYYLYDWTRCSVLAIIAATIIHSIWNYFIAH